MSPFRVREPETQWDEHHPPGHPRPREAKSQEAQLESEVVHGGSGAVKRQMSAKLSVPGIGTDKKEPELNDDALRDEVQRALDNDGNVGPYALEADVVEGIARVSGIVDTLAGKQHAEKIVRQVPGVRSFEDGVSLSTDGQITDKGVEMEVGEELADIPNLREKVGVKVTDGTAYLKGRVDSKEEKEQAVEAAAKARGVSSVVSQLKVGERQRLDVDDPEAVFHSQVRNDKEGKDKTDR